MNNGNGDIELPEIVRLINKNLWEKIRIMLEKDIIICYLLGRHGLPNMGDGLIINNKETIYSLSMPIMDFYEFERRVRVCSQIMNRKEVIYYDKTTRQ